MAGHYCDHVYSAKGNREDDNKVTDVHFIQWDDAEEENIKYCG